MIVILTATSCSGWRLGTAAHRRQASRSPSARSATSTTVVDWDGPSGPRPTAAPTTTTVAVAVRGVVAGDWAHHGFGISIDPSGLASMTWRTYRVCGTDPPPCDTFSGNEIIDGGHATVVLRSTSSTTAAGRVITTTDPATMAIGPISVRVDPVHDKLFVSATGGLAFCGPHAPEPNDCGA
jgi:hypothetical protein